jgi:hypothetical protein
MADFTRGEEDAEASSSPLDHAFAPRMLRRGLPVSTTQNSAMTSYRWVSPEDGRTRHRIILGQIASMRSQAGVIVYEPDPLDWFLQPVLALNRDEMDRRGMLGNERSLILHHSGVDVKAVEVPDPVAEGEDEGRRGATVILVSTERGTIMAFRGESLAFLGAVNRRKGYVRRLTPYYAYTDGGARRLRVVASGRGGPYVWDFSGALSGNWESGQEPGVLMHELELAEEVEEQMVFGAEYYETSDGGHRWGLGGGRIGRMGLGLEQRPCVHCARIAANISSQYTVLLTMMMIVAWQVPGREQDGPGTLLGPRGQQRGVRPDRRS